MLGEGSDVGWGNSVVCHGLDKLRGSRERNNYRFKYLYNNYTIIFIQLYNKDTNIYTIEHLQYKTLKTFKNR